MRPLFKPYVQFSPREDGVYLKTWTGEFVLKGATLYPWIEQLAFNLDGKKTLDELTSTLPEAHAKFVRQLVGELHKRGVVVDLVDDAALDEKTESQFRQTLLFLAEHTAKPNASFLEFTKLKGQIAGSGLSYRAFVRTLLKMGLHHAECEPTTDEGLNQFLREWQIERPEAHVTFGGEGGTERPDFVAYVSDEPDVEQIAALVKSCEAAGVPLFVATVLEGLGVVCESGDGKPGWNTLLERLHRREPSSEYVQAPTFRMMIGNLAALEAFKALSGMADDQARGDVLLLNPDTLESSKQQLFTAPFANDTAAQNRDDFFRLAESELIAEHIGVLSNLQPGALWQIPMPHMGVTVHFPASLGLAPVQLAAPGESLQDAQERVLRRAVLRFLQDTQPAPNGEVWAEGYSEGEWTGRGLLQVLHSRAVVSGAKGILPLDELTDRQSAMYAKMLRLRYALDVQLVELESDVEGVYCQLVTHNNRILAQASARTRHTAARAALLDAVSHVQLQRNNPEYTVDVPSVSFDIDLLPVLEWGAEEAPVEWSDWNLFIKEVLQQKGFAITQVEQGRMAGLLIGRLGMTAAQTEVTNDEALGLGAR